MTLRKINAVLSLVTALLLIDHAGFYTVWMLSRGSIAKSADNMPMILACLVLVHALLSIAILVRDRRGAKIQALEGQAPKTQAPKTYPKQNIPTYIQRISGVLMLVLLGFHIAGKVTSFQPAILHAIIQPVFFAAALAHISVSVSKSMITLGIGTAKIIKIIDIIMAVICGVILVAALIGFYLCFFKGVTA